MVIFLAAIVGGALVWFSNQHTAIRPKKVIKINHIKATAIGDSLTYGVGDPRHRGGYTYLIWQIL